MKTVTVLMLFSIISFTSFAQLVQKISLPEPEKESGIPLMKALDNRKSSREFDDTKMLSNQQISNILWAAYGFNRPDGKRTAPSSFNQQPVTIYVAMKGGMFLWDPKANVLNQVAAGDLRAETGTQPYVAKASMNLILVSDYSKLVKSKTEEDKAATSNIECGAIIQNVYLYCASDGLAACVRSSVDRAALAKTLKLSATQHIIITQSVGIGL